jgi:hypothetical protein
MKASCVSTICGYEVNVIRCDINTVPWADRDASKEVGTARINDACNQIDIALNKALNDTAIRSVLLHELSEVWLVANGCAFEASNGNCRAGFFMFDHMVFSSMIQEVAGAFKDICNKMGVK